MGGGEIKRVLVLSGGGGRGAYQVGVCRALEQLHWQPDMVLGNSIGATNGALLLAPRGEESGAALLARLWQDEMLNDTLQHVAPQWPLLLQEALGIVLKMLQEIQTPPILSRPADSETSFGLGSTLAEMRQKLSRRHLFERWLPQEMREQQGELPWYDYFIKLAARLHKMKSPLTEELLKPAVMERKNWQQLLAQYVDFEQLNDPAAPYFGIAATDVATGALRMFWNHVPPGVDGQASRMTPEHIMASSSIPGFYEATPVEGRTWWDGALLANTPVAPALVVAAEEIVVVLMTPWHESPDGEGVPLRGASPTILDALDRALDWLMLSSFRSELQRLTPEQRKKVRIIAPTALLGLTSIIDYHPYDNAVLARYGYQDALAVLQPRSQEEG